jgi:hypothetical protein
VPALRLGGLVRPRVTGDQIATAALRYRGHPYSYGVWDCSGFANHVLGQDLGFTLPGGLRGYRGPPPHGPVVDDYQGWGQAVSSPARGDLVLFLGLGPNGHMGFVLGPDQMVSALDPALGTTVTPIRGYGPPGAPIVYRRATGAAPGAPAGGGPGASAPGAGQPGTLQAAGMAVLVVGAMAGAVVLAAAVVGAAAVVVGSWVVSRAAG